ncbi:M28 family peptidase [Algimonas porphyrae]|uniref:Peptidase M28 domain-containing protein n=2 Tax=Algimonas porphyrae TaxID=1128113 RepID=A0ABQ5V0W3_9PROT|nr:hypothetical protein GCM10007854_15520 [Algimonas porphyrae]
MGRLFQPRRKPFATALALLLASLFLLFLFSPKLIDAPRVDPDHPFNTQATIERLSRILGDESPHPVDSAVSDAVIDRLSTEIRQLGFEPIIDDAFHCSDRRNVACARVRNVGFWVTPPGPDAVMLASHHDSVPTGPGAADDGMGVASSLEIARLMKDRPLPRPLYVLITDGEEIGLVGAARFVRHDPVAPMIGAVVSLEARGNRGPAAMFETSDPNGRDLAALKPHPEDRVKGAVASSLSVDIYRAMPNGTDVTEYLTLDMDAANYAMTGHESHYHTRHDNLANLDRASVFHIGSSALSAVEGFMTVNEDSTDRAVIYADVLGFGVLSLPEHLAQPLIGLALILCVVALFRTDRKPAPLWRVLLLPLLALIAGTGVAILGGMAIDALRPESAYGTAWPIALRGVLISLSLLTAAFCARWLYRPDGADRFLVGAWAVMMSLGLTASFLFFGASVLFALPALLVIPAALLIILKQTSALRIVALILFALSAVLIAVLGLTMYVMAETALFVETSAPLTAFVVWTFIVLLPIVWTRPGSTRWPLYGAAAAVMSFGAASLLVPAYSEDAPLGRSLVHLAGDGFDGAHYTISARDPLPNPMRAAGDFTQGELSGYSRNLWITPAPPPDVVMPQIDILDNQIVDGTRRVALRIDAPDSDRIRISMQSDRTNSESLTLNGQLIALDGRSFPNITCTGRTCRELTMAMVLPDREEPINFNVWSTRYGHDAAADALLKARPDWMVPQHEGDRRSVRRRIAVPAPGPAPGPALIPASEPAEE